MKRFLILLLISLIPFFTWAQGVEFEILEQTTEGMQIRVTFPNYTLQTVEVEGQLMQKIVIPKAYPIDQKGYPQFLKSSTSLIVSEGNLPIVEMISAEYDWVYDFDLAPSRGRIYRNQNLDTILYKKGSAYQESRFLGDDQGVVGDIYQLRDFYGVTISVSPYAYNPVARTLKVYHSMVLQVRFSRPNVVPMAYRNTITYHEVYQEHFLNYQSQRTEPLAEEGELLILAPDNFVDALLPLKEWKIKCGIPTTIVPLSVAGATSTAVKSFITNYYNNHNLAFVIAVGDNAQFPAIRESSWWSYSVLDNKYAEVAGNDNYPDLFFSKLSANNVDQVTTQVNKILAYEQAIGEINHYSVTAGIASQEGPGDDNEYDYQHIRNILHQLTNYTYTQMYEFYEGSQGGEDASGNPTPTQISQKINEGIGLINYCGHGDYNKWVTSGFNNNHIGLLTNFGKLPVIISTACVNGDYYNQTCFAESWLWARTNDYLTGAVGTVMSTINQAWNPPMCGQDEMMDLLTEVNPSRVRRTFGGVVFGGLFKILDEYDDDETTRTWLIFGDASMLLRTAVPQQLQASHLPLIPFGTNSFIVQSDVENAKFCLSNGDTIFDVATVQNGEAILNVPMGLSPTDTLYLVGTMFNYIPYQATISFSLFEEPYVMVNSIYFTNSQGDTVNPEYGKEVDVNVVLINLGQQVAEQVSLNISTQDAYGRFVRIAEEDDFNLQPFETRVLERVSKLIISDEVPFGYEFPMVFSITNNGVSKDTLYEVHLFAPAPFIGDVVVDDQNSNVLQNGSLDIGESAILKFKLANVGDAPSQIGSVLLESLTNHVAINRPLNSMASLGQEDSCWLNFRVSVDDKVPANTEERFRLTYQYGAYSVSKEFSLVISQIVAIDEYAENKIVIYPNPTLGNVRIEANDFMHYVQILDATGREILLVDVQNFALNLNVDNYPSGIYYIRILDKEHRIVNVNKLIKN